MLPSSPRQPPTLAFSAMLLFSLKVSRISRMTPYAMLTRVRGNNVGRARMVRTCVVSPQIFPILGMAMLLGACERGTTTTPAGSNAIVVGDNATPNVIVRSTSIDTTSAAENATGAPVTRQVSPARDADQQFLRRMLDHYETTIAIAHDAMMSPGGHTEHGDSADPAKFDSALDAEKRAMLALLDTLYHEQYSPVDHRPRQAAPSAGDVASKRVDHGVAEATGITMHQALAHQLADGARLIDQSMPRLRRARVRALAIQMRRTAHALLQLAQSSAMTMDMSKP